MPKKMTNLEFLEKLNKTHGDKYLPMDQYVNTDTKINMQCKSCDHMWKVTPHSLFSMRSGCPECGKIKSKKTEKWKKAKLEFKEKVKNKHSNTIEVIGDYRGVHEKVVFKCRTCENLWFTSPDSILRGHGCPECGKKRQGLKTRITHEEYEKRIKDYFEDTLVLQSKYITSRQKIKVKCLKCFYEWETCTRSLLGGRGCRKCHASLGEQKISKLLEDNNIDYKSYFYFKDLTTSKGHLLRFDFAVFSNDNISHLIEFDGKQHFQPVEKFGGEQQFKIQIKNDNLKNEYCKNKKLKLIRIPYYDIDKITIEDLI